jgi:hypothetical protein
MSASNQYRERQRPGRTLNGKYSQRNELPLAGTAGIPARTRATARERTYLKSPFELIDSTCMLLLLFFSRLRLIAGGTPALPVTCSSLRSGKLQLANYFRALRLSADRMSAFPVRCRVFDATHHLNVSLPAGPSPRLRFSQSFLSPSPDPGVLRLRLDGTRTAVAPFAMHHCLAIGVYLVHAINNLSQ